MAFLMYRGVAYYVPAIASCLAESSTQFSYIDRSIDNRQKKCPDRFIVLRYRGVLYLCDR
jgi:hypothetical protein